MTKRLSIFAVAAGLTIALGCGSASQSPSEVIEAAYMAANEGNYSEALEYLSSEIHTAIEAGKGSGMKQTWDRVTRDGSIERIEFLTEDIRGEGATVRFRLHYSGGQSKEDDEPLILENGKWKITIG